MKVQRRKSARQAVGAAVTLLAALAWVGACSGDSAFPTLPGGSVGPGPGNGGPDPSDATRPSVSIELPAPGFTVAVGDSVFVQARISDDQALASLELSGFALRGSAELGTQQRVERFATKTVSFDPAVRVVRDTVITRFLLATADDLRESPVYLVATVRDAAGNTAADTVEVSIGGPRVEIVSPAPGTQLRAGTDLQVVVSARDRTDQIRSLRLVIAGAADATLVQDFPAPQDSVEVTFTFPIPAAAQGDLRLTAIAESRANIQAASREVVVRVVPPTADVTPPTVRFSLGGLSRAELRDSVEIQVSATDDTRVDSVGVHLRTFRLIGTQLTELEPVLRSVPAASHTFRVPLHQIINPTDTATIALEVTAFAVDSARNCAFAVIPDTDSATPCRTDPAGNRIFPDPGARLDIFITRGRTIGLSTGSRVADLASVGGRLFLSNITRNRVEVLQVGDSVLGAPISVGSEPWGLAIGFGGTNLYVANSGGTNISVVPLTGGQLAESRRIRTSDIRLYDVAYDIVTDTVNTVTEIDYSDRPQFLAQTNQGQLLYSTKPTPTRADGTVRIYDPAKDTTYAFNRGSEIFVGYATRTLNRAVVVNALDAGKLVGGRIQVCPRRLAAAQADPNCIAGFVSDVSGQLAALRAANLTDTRLDLNRDARTIGLSDTTFVAVSGDHSTVAFGEGVVDFGRIMRFQVGPQGQLDGTTTQTQDLVGNAAERVIGLALNQDGTLGVARGNQVYFWDSVLRLEGVVQSGSPAGGAAVHPENRDYPNPGTGSRLGFASGIDAQGQPYVDVLDAYSFRTVRRIDLRDPVVGSVIAVPVAPGDPGAGTVAVRIFAVTTNGVVQVDLSEADLQP